MEQAADRIEPRTLKGFRDILPNDLIRRNQIIATIADALHLYGFTPLETPALEYAEILTGKLGDEGEKLLYQFTDHGNRRVAMRYDFTVPLARVVAQHTTLPFPFKRYQVGPVWRADNTQRGRFREFYQFDFDIVGSKSNIADAEILVAMQTILRKLNVPNFTIRVNDRRYLANIAQEVNLSSNESQVLYAGLDKWDKIGGANGVKKYWQENGMGLQQADFALRLLQDEESLANHPIKQTITVATSMGLDPAHIKIDPTIVRGLDYYTGIIYETTLDDAPEFGSVLSGGRYDHLIGRFSKQDIPAVGASVGLDRLIAALESLQSLEIQQSHPRVFVTVFSHELQKYSLEVVQQLRNSGVPTEIYLEEPTGIGKQLKMASTKNATYALILGPEEVEHATVTLKNLQTGKEVTISKEELISAVR